jgi:hypothetical protein
MMSSASVMARPAAQVVEAIDQLVGRHALSGMIQPCARSAARSAPLRAEMMNHLFV